jgi:hypothetical protein
MATLSVYRSPTSGRQSNTAEQGSLPTITSIAHFRKSMLRETESMTVKSTESAGRISLFAFTVAFVSYLVLNRYFAPAIFPNYADQIILIESLATLGIFETVFLGVLWVYENYLFKKFHRLRDIGGKWYQILTVQGARSASAGIRHGPCIISSVSEAIALSGENNKLNNAPSSNWQSDITVLNGRELMVLYHSEGRDRRINPIRKGTMVFEILDDPPSKLQGQWSDVMPAQNSGAIEIFRNLTAYRQRLREIRRRFRNP